LNTDQFRLVKWDSRNNPSFLILIVDPDLDPLLRSVGVAVQAKQSKSNLIVSDAPTILW
jgi:hypothetical protein